MYTTNYVANFLHMFFVLICCNIEMFRMFEKRESETENDEGKYDAHFRLKN